MASRRPGVVPLWLKVAYTLFMLLWVPVVWQQYGPSNFLWLCDVANFVLLAALWLESPVLVSSQAVSVLIIQAVWIVDFVSRLVFGVHPIGGTQYMFDAAEPLYTRLVSLFHVFVPAILLWTTYRLGYDRRGFKLQTAIAWAILPVSFLVGDETTNFNWLWRPFESPQTLVPAAVYLLFAMVAYPLVLYLPTHLALGRWMPPVRQLC